MTVYLDNINFYSGPAPAPSRSALGSITNPANKRVHDDTAEATDRDDLWSTPPPLEQLFPSHSVMTEREASRRDPASSNLGASLDDAIILPSDYGSDESDIEEPADKDNSQAVPGMDVPSQQQQPHEPGPRTASSRTSTLSPGWGRHPSLPAHSPHSPQCSGAQDLDRAALEICSNYGHSDAEPAAPAETSSQWHPESGLGCGRADSQAIESPSSENNSQDNTDNIDDGPVEPRLDAEDVDWSNGSYRPDDDCFSGPSPESRTTSEENSLFSDSNTSVTGPSTDLPTPKFPSQLLPPLPISCTGPNNLKQGESVVGQTTTIRTFKATHEQAVAATHQATPLPASELVLSTPQRNTRASIPREDQPGALNSPTKRSRPFPTEKRRPKRACVRERTPLRSNSRSEHALRSRTCSSRLRARLNVAQDGASTTESGEESGSGGDISDTDYEPLVAQSHEADGDKNEGGSDTDASDSPRQARRHSRNSHNTDDMCHPRRTSPRGQGHATPVRRSHSIASRSSSYGSVSNAKSTDPGFLAVFEEWPLHNAVLKRVTENGGSTIQLQFTWDTSQKTTQRGSQRKRRQAAATPSKSPRFTVEEDRLLKRLKSGPNMSWKKIYKDFSDRLPGRRSMGALQVRYSTQLKG